MVCADAEILALQVTDLSGDQVGFVANAAARPAWNEFAIDHHDSVLPVTKVDGFFDRQLHCGSLRLRARAVVDGKIRDTPTLELRRFVSSGFRAAISEQFGLPYLFGSGDCQKVSIRGRKPISQCSMVRKSRSLRSVISALSRDLKSRRHPSEVAWPPRSPVHVRAQTWWLAWSTGELKIPILSPTNNASSLAGWSIVVSTLWLGRTHIVFSRSTFIMAAQSHIPWVISCSMARRPSHHGIIARYSK